MADIASIKGFRAKHAARKKEAQEKTSRSGALLAKMARDGAIGSKILAHNGFIAAVYALAMFLVAYVALQAAFYFVAFLAGSTGAYQMADQADVLTVYVIIAMICGFCLFFAFAIERALMRAMAARFWHRDPDAEGGIDRGAAYNKKHAGR